MDFGVIGGVILLIALAGGAYAVMNRNRRIASGPMGEERPGRPVARGGSAPAAAPEVLPADLLLERIMEARRRMAEDHVLPQESRDAVDRILDRMLVDLPQIDTNASGPESMKMVQEAAGERFVRLMDDPNVPGWSDAVGALAYDYERLLQLVSLDHDPPRDSHRIAQLRRSLETIRSLPTMLPPARRKGLKVQDARANDILRIEGRYYRVRETLSYKDREGYEWFELKVTNMEDGSMTIFEWEVDDRLETYLMEDEVTLDEVRLTPEKLRTLEGGDVSCHYMGRSYRYAGSNSATCVDEDGKTEQLYYWDFRSGGSKIGVERWGDAYRVYVMRSVKPGEIVVLREATG